MTLPKQLDYAAPQSVGGRLSNSGTILLLMDLKVQFLFLVATVVLLAHLRIKELEDIHMLIHGEMWGLLKHFTMSI